jgi:hypothetical protein
VRSVLLVVCGLGGLALVAWIAWGGGDGTSRGGGSTTSLPTPEPRPSPPPVTPEPPPQGASSDEPTFVRHEETPPPPPRGADVPFVGDVYLANEDGTMRPGGEGHFELWMLAGGETSTVRIPVSANKFVTTVPERSTLRVLGGELSGHRVRFERPAGPFSPNPERHALVGVPVPEIALRAVAAGTGADLSDLTIRFADGPGGGRLTSEARREVVMSAVDSPAILPWLDVRHPVWLEVEAPGFAPARVLIDPARPAERTLELHPAAGALTVAVSGPGRWSLADVVVHRLQPDGVRPVAAHVSAMLLLPDIDAHSDPRVFVFTGLGRGEHEVRLTSYDRRRIGGAELTHGRIDLQPGAAAHLALYAPEP